MFWKNYIKLDTYITGIFISTVIKKLEIGGGDRRRGKIKLAFLQ